MKNPSSLETRVGPVTSHRYLHPLPHVSLINRFRDYTCLELKKVSNKKNVYVKITRASLTLTFPYDFVYSAHDGYISPYPVGIPIDRYTERIV